MDEAVLPNEEVLRQRLGETRERLAGLERDRSVLDAELELLDGERPQYQLLEEACAALEKLGDGENIHKDVLETSGIDLASEEQAPPPALT